jgi:hypothetical protein
MSNRGQLIVGAAIIVVGLIILIGNVLNINLWSICWPTALILLGLWVLFGPRLSGNSSEVTILPIGDVRRDESWDISDEDFWLFVGDIDLDLSQADIPLGETRFQIYSFAGDVELLVPPDVGVAISCTAFVSTVKAFGGVKESFLAPQHRTSDNYATADRKIRLNVTCFAGEVSLGKG